MRDVPDGSPSVRAGAATILLAAPAVLLAVWPAATRTLEYDRARIAAGELWRVVTSHWTHWTPEHLGWDLLAFVVLAFLGWREHSTRCVSTLVASAVLIPAGVWLWLPELQRYRGLSGIDSALFVLLAALLLRRELRDRQRVPALIFGLALIGFAGKIGFEIVSGSTLFVESSGFVPIPLAHVIGGLCGAVGALAPDRRPHFGILFTRSTTSRPMTRFGRSC